MDTREDHLRLIGSATFASCDLLSRAPPSWPLGTVSTLCTSPIVSYTFYPCRGLPSLGKAASKASKVSKVSKVSKYNTVNMVNTQITLLHRNGAKLLLRQTMGERGLSMLSSCIQLRDQAAYRQPDFLLLTASFTVSPSSSLRD